MKNEKPFFAQFLEHQIKEDTKITGGDPSGFPGDVKVTLKYPSDNEDGIEVTMKYPSDGEDGPGGGILL